MKLPKFCKQCGRELEFVPKREATGFDVYSGKENPPIETAVLACPRYWRQDYAHSMFDWSREEWEELGQEWPRKD